jgi:hypothetical protein
MMDAQRQISTDNGNAPTDAVKQIAAQGGLVRVYNHQSSNPTSPASSRMLNWIVNPKTDFAYENWKATDGEAASYVYARHTTSVAVNSSIELGYDVQRLDPRNAGYWLVPVTVSINLDSHVVRSVYVIEHAASGDVLQELKPLNGKRVMDVGYDIRDGALQVSAFFNASATIVVDITTGDPHIITTPITDAFTGESYSYLATSTASPSARPLQWTFDNSSAPWLTGQVAGDRSYLISGIAGNGTFRLSLTVGDGFRSDIMNWTLTATPKRYLNITSTPETICSANVYYQYQVVCQGAATWRLEGDAYWLVLDPDGRLHGYAPKTEIGKDVQVKIIAVSGSLSTSQNFTLHVNTNPADNPDVILPFIGITVIMALILVLILSRAFGKK